MATQRTDGRWMARKQIEKQKLTAYGSTNEEAEAALQEKILDLQAMSSTPKRQRLHDIAIRLWFPQLDYVAHTSKVRYIGTYRKWLADQIGQLEIAEITMSDCQGVISAAQKVLAPNSVMTVRSVMHQIFRAAQIEGLITINPSEFVKVPKRPEKRVRVLTVEEAGKFLEAIEGTEFSAPCFLACVLGLRRGELLGLKWDDLDRQRGELTIQRQRVIHHYGEAAKRAPEVKEVALKTSSSRRVLHLTKELITEIDRRGNLDSVWICTRKGKPWTPDTLSEEWLKKRKDFKLPDWRFHDLRHGAAGLLYAAGCDAILIAAVLGHSKPDMSLIYTDATQRHRVEAGQKLSDLLSFSTADKTVEQVDEVPL